MEYREIEGDLIALAKAGEFDVIAHGCNCMCAMKKGLAPLMAQAFGCDKYPLEYISYKGDINKLGQIEAYYGRTFKAEGEHNFFVVNCYTQYMWATSENPKPLDYAALRLCLKKLNHMFRGESIGLPKIGCGLAGGAWEVVKMIIQEEMVGCKVTIVLDKNQTK